MVVSFLVENSTCHLSSEPAANRSACRSAVPVVGLAALRQGLDGANPSFYLILPSERVHTNVRVLGDTETAHPVTGCDLTVSESGRCLRGAVRTARGVPERVQPVLGVCAGEATVTWQGLKTKVGEVGTGRRKSTGSLIAQARKWVRRGSIPENCTATGGTTVSLDQAGSPARSKGGSWNPGPPKYAEVVLSTTRAASEALAVQFRSSGCLTWEALRRARGVAPRAATLSVGDLVSRVRGARRCGRSQFRGPGAAWDARKPEARVLTLAWTADDTESGYNSNTWSESRACRDLDSRRTYRDRENNGYQTEYGTRNSAQRQALPELKRPSGASYYRWIHAALPAGHYCAQHSLLGWRNSHADHCCYGNKAK